MNKNQVRKLSNSPFRYPGGKFYARKLILPCIPKHNKYCEPFVGGGSIFFAKNNSKVNILNDKDKEIFITNYDINNVSGVEPLVFIKQLSLF